ncbi:MAG: hypothetical protein K0S07_1050 [Chlamydiales bacterium]|jgi:hypothetical protein|nr:hypothetical protein [Chlamydiales bacterium]
MNQVPPFLRDGAPHFPLGALPTELKSALFYLLDEKGQRALKGVSKIWREVFDSIPSQVTLQQNPSADAFDRTSFHSFLDRLSLKSSFAIDLSNSSQEQIELLFHHRGSEKLRQIRIDFTWINLSPSYKKSYLELQTSLEQTISAMSQMVLGMSQLDLERFSAKGQEVSKNSLEKERWRRKLVPFHSSPFPQLQKLDLEHFTNADLPFLKSLLKNAWHLQELSLHAEDPRILRLALLDCPKSIESLSTGCRAFLNLEEGAILIRCWATLGETLQDLNHLHIEHRSHCSLKGDGQIYSQNKKLQSLHLVTYHLADSGLNGALESAPLCPELKWLTLELTSIDDQVLLRLKEQCPKLLKLCLINCKYSYLQGALLRFSGEHALLADAAKRVWPDIELHIR